MGVTVVAERNTSCGSTEEVIAKVDAIAARLDSTKARFDEAVERFNSLAPTIDKILRERKNEDQDDAAKAG